VARRRTTVVATIFDTEGYPFVSFRGNAQDVGDACAIYVTNIANPLGGHIFTPIELIQNRDEEES
jgi:hypothetical protein